MRRTTFQLLNEKSLASAREQVKLMSKYEGFDDKHGGSLDVRFNK